VVRLLSVLLAGLMVGGCTGILPGQRARPPETYVLAPALPAAKPPSRRGPTIVVSRPGAGAGYDTFQMAYFERDYRLDYFAYNEWVDPPAVMLRHSLKDMLRGTGRFSAVTGDARGVASDLRLDTTLVAMHQDFRTQPSVGRVIVEVQIVDLEGRRILGTRTFEAQAPAPSDDAYGGVVAINEALTRLLAEIAGFAVSQAADP
jgi:cholesterol transport system auxiliary component